METLSQDVLLTFGELKQDKIVEIHGFKNSKKADGKSVKPIFGQPFSQGKS